MLSLLMQWVYTVIVTFSIYFVILIIVVFVNVVVVVNNEANYQLHIFGET